MLGLSITIGSSKNWNAGQVWEEQAVSLTVQTLQDHLGLAALELSWMQILRKPLDLA